MGFHLALLDDDHFEILPGSNRRARTQARAVLLCHCAPSAFVLPAHTQAPGRAGRRRHATHNLVAPLRLVWLSFV